MHTVFRRVELPRELRSLLIFDRKVFRESDRFDKDYWQTLESYWMVVDKVKVGCCAFERHLEHATLYIATTGVLPRFQRGGLGRLLKAWEIAFARHHGFRRLVTNCRKRNVAMIKLNKSFGFRTVRSMPGYYFNPTDSTVFMELHL